MHQVHHTTHQENLQPPQLQTMRHHIQASACRPVHQRQHWHGFCKRWWQALLLLLAPLPHTALELSASVPSAPATPANSHALAHHNI